MSEIKLSGQIVVELLEKFPGASTLALARIAYRDNIEVFMSVEHARGIIRYHRGSNGERARKSLKNKKYVRKQVQST